MKAIVARAVPGAARISFCRSETELKPAGEADRFSFYAEADGYHTPPSQLFSFDC